MVHDILIPRKLRHNKECERIELRATKVANLISNSSQMSATEQLRSIRDPVYDDGKGNLEHTGVVECLSSATKNHEGLRERTR